jgi:hypothetical protein
LSKHFVPGLVRLNGADHVPIGSGAFIPKHRITGLTCAHLLSRSLSAKRWSPVGNRTKTQSRWTTAAGTMPECIRRSIENDELGNAYCDHLPFSRAAPIADQGELNCL